MQQKIPLNFYNREDVVTIARELLGATLVTNIDGIITSGKIVETEAYAAENDRSSHAYLGRRTERNEMMYAAPGSVYVYLCYGVHKMINIITNKIDVPEAILIRAVEPLLGIEAMATRTGKSTNDVTLTKGPGNLTTAFGITKALQGNIVDGNSIYLLTGEMKKILNEEVGVSKRIGIDGAGEDAFLPWRFYLKGNKHVSASPRK